MDFVCTELFLLHSFPFLLVFFIEYQKRDLNPHTVRCWLLRPVCIPFHHSDICTVYEVRTHLTHLMRVGSFPLSHGIYFEQIPRIELGSHPYQGRVITDYTTTAYYLVLQVGFEPTTFTTRVWDFKSHAFQPVSPLEHFNLCTSGGI